ncbi:MAG TPA: HAMP domain-containing sensor histidine kinase [Flavobacterium sp.]|nr:HAMP domain-containing sensor histidine kinase [Flavobacterium sp.]
MGKYLFKSRNHQFKLLIWWLGCVIFLIFFACSPGAESTPEAGRLTAHDFHRQYSYAEIQKVRQLYGSAHPVALRMMMSHLLYESSRESYPTRDTLNLIDRLTRQSNDSIFRSVYHILEARYQNKYNRHLCYLHAVKARDFFEATQDTFGMVDAYKILAHRSGTTTDDGGISASDLKRYEKRLTDLVRSSSHIEHRQYYLQSLLISDLKLIKKQDIRYFEGIYRQFEALRPDSILLWTGRQNLMMDYYYKEMRVQSDSMMQVCVATAPMRRRSRALLDSSYASKITTPDQQIAVYLKALAAYERTHIHDNQLLFDIYDCMADAFRRKNDFRNALEYTVLKDSVEAAEALSQKEVAVQTLESRYKVKQKDAELLQKEKERRKFYYLFLMGALVAIITTALGYYNYVTRRKLQALNQQQEDVKRVISHDLLSPLSALEMLNTRMEKSLPDDGSISEGLRRQRLYLHHIQGLCHNLVGWLWHDRSDANQEMALEEVIRGVLLELEAFFASYETKVGYELSGPASELQLSDPNAFRTIVRNLLTNSVRHGKAHVIKMSIDTSPKHLKFRILDDGAVIDTELAKRLGDFLNGQADQRNISGLGLYLAGRFLKRLRGRYEVVPATEDGFSNSHNLLFPLNRSKV